MVKKAAKSPLKNISSEPSQIMTPIASIGGRSWTIFPCGAGTSAETAWVTGQFLVDRVPEAPTSRQGVAPLVGALNALVSAGRSGAVPACRTVSRLVGLVKAT